MDLLGTYNNLKMIYEAELRKKMRSEPNQYRKSLEDLRAFLDMSGYKMPKQQWQLAPKFKG